MFLNLRGLSPRVFERVVPFVHLPQECRRGCVVSGSHACLSPLLRSSSVCAFPFVVVFLERVLVSLCRAALPSAASDVISLVLLLFPHFLLLVRFPVLLSPDCNVGLSFTGAQRRV